MVELTFEHHDVLEPSISRLQQHIGAITENGMQNRIFIPSQVFDKAQKNAVQLRQKRRNLSFLTTITTNFSTNRLQR